MVGMRAALRMAALANLVFLNHAISCHSPANADQIYFTLFHRNAYQAKLSPFNVTVRAIVAAVGVESVSAGTATLLFAALLVWGDARLEWRTRFKDEFEAGGGAGECFVFRPGDVWAPLLHLSDPALRILRSETLFEPSYIAHSDGSVASLNSLRVEKLVSLDAASYPWDELTIEVAFFLGNVDSRQLEFEAMAGAGPVSVPPAWRLLSSRCRPLRLPHPHGACVLRLRRNAAAAAWNFAVPSFIIAMVSLAALEWASHGSRRPEPMLLLLAVAAQTLVLLLNAPSTPAFTHLHSMYFVNLIAVLCYAFVTWILLFLKKRQQTPLRLLRLARIVAAAVLSFVLFVCFSWFLIRS